MQNYCLCESGYDEYGGKREVASRLTMMKIETAKEISLCRWLQIYLSKQLSVKKTRKLALTIIFSTAGKKCYRTIQRRRGHRR